MLISLVMSLALTLVLEELFALIWGLQGRRELGTVALVNVLTNPPVERRNGDGGAGDGGSAGGVALLPPVLRAAAAAPPVCSPG